MSKYYRLQEKNGMRTMEKREKCKEIKRNGEKMERKLSYENIIDWKRIMEQIKRKGENEGGKKRKGE